MPDIHEDQPIDDPIYQRLLELEKEDKLTAEAVLAEAVDPASPFHGVCDWDDASAARMHRLHQVRQLIGRYRMVRVTAEGETVRYRALTHIKSEGRYHDTDRALRDWREEVLAAAKRMMGVYALKYRQLGKAALLEIALEVLSEHKDERAA